MTNLYQRSGDKIDITTAGNVTQGTVYTGTDIYGVYLETGTTGDLVPVALSGIFDLAKASVATTIGQRVYVSSGSITTTATGEQFGYAVEVTATGDSNVKVKICHE